jgi:hypothetical protein
MEVREKNSGKLELATHHLHTGEGREKGGREGGSGHVFFVLC